MELELSKLRKSINSTEYENYHELTKYVRLVYEQIVKTTNQFNNELTTVRDELLFHSKSEEFLLARKGTFAKCKSDLIAIIDNYEK